MAAFDPVRQQARGRSLPGVLRIPSAGMVAAATLVAAAALLPVVQSSSATTAGYETRRLESQKADLQAAIYNAQTEIAQLGSLERIDREARGRLGMVPVERTVSVQVTEPAPATSALPARFLPSATEQPHPPKARSRARALLSKLAFR